MATPVHLLEEDPELGDALDPQRRAAAERDVRALCVPVARGPWEMPGWPTTLRQGLGLLVLDGILLRETGIEGRNGAELLGGGDVLRPWEEVSASVGMWRALSRTRTALLDLDFVRRCAPYPELFGALMERSVRRSRRLVINVAIIHQPRVDTRVHMVLWHLAERWGVVRTDGVLLPVPLTHEALAALVAARRPTVSTAISELARGGLVERVTEGWLLHGSPPGELVEVAGP